MPSHRVVPGANPTDAPDDRQAMRRARARRRGDAPVVVPRPRAERGRSVRTGR